MFSFLDTRHPFVKHIHSLIDHYGIDYPRSGKTLSLTSIMQPNTPFHIQDTIRNTKFLALYHWGLSIQFPPRKAYHVAKTKTMKEYPIKQGEPLYPIT